MPIKIDLAKVNVPLSTYEQSWRITYFDSADTEQTLLDGTTADYNNFLYGDFTRRSLRTGIGAFSISLYNPEGYYNSLITKGTKIKAYCDRIAGTSTPTNVIFVGYADSAKHSLADDNTFTFKIQGRDNARIADLHITKDYSAGITASAAIQDIIDEFFPGQFTYANISPDMTGIIYGQYVDQLALSVIVDILKQVGYDGYIDFNNDIHTFVLGSNLNGTEKIIYGTNMLPFSEVGQDFIDEINRVRVYGATTENTLLVSTQNDTTLQDETWIKSKVTTASNLETTTTVTQKALTELDQDSTPFYGELISAYILTTLNPGESIQCSCQYANIAGNYSVSSLTHSLSVDSLGQTSVNINKEEDTAYVEIGQNTEQVTSLSTKNINGMTDTAILLRFEDSSQISSLGNCTLLNGNLSITSGFTQGTIISEIVDMGYDVTSFEVRTKVNSFCGESYFQVSNDGGQTYNNSATRYNLVGDTNSVIDFTSAGQRIVVKITLVSSATNTIPELESFTLLVK